MKKKNILPIRVLSIMLFMFASFLLGMSTCSAQEAGEAEVFEDSLAQIPSSPANVVAKDAPNDGGHALVVTWTLSSDDGAGKNNVISYDILRSDNPEFPLQSPFIQVLRRRIKGKSEKSGCCLE